MGYSTAIYAVDLEKLSAAVGSGDERLVKRLLPRGRPKRHKRAKDEELRLIVNKKSELYLNRQLVSLDQLVAQLSRPKWKSRRLFYYEMPSRTGRWRKEHSAFFALVDALPANPWLDMEMCYSLKQFKSGAAEDDEDDELSEGEAAADLVEGAVLRGTGSEYGYGLERLCRALGTLLAGIEGKGGMLNALKLNTPLSKERSPVKLPKSKDDFPLIGYLTADEVEREVKRLEGMDLSYPKDELIEQDRKELLGALRKAAKKGVGVVAFYH